MALPAISPTNTGSLSINVILREGRMLRCYVGVISFLLLPLMVPTWSFSKSLNATSVKPVANAIFPEQNHAEVFLGQLLFYDPILSGNKTVACATCHHQFASDGVSLGLGMGN